MIEDTQGFTIHVYMDDGRVYKYTVESADKAREHSDAIVRHGYRHNPKGGQIFEAYGPHRVLKVKVTGGKIPTRYPDIEATGT